jgi:hypothetical protein
VIPQKLPRSVKSIPFKSLALVAFIGQLCGELQFAKSTRVELEKMFRFVLTSKKRITSTGKKSMATKQRGFT